MEKINAYISIFVLLLFTACEKENGCFQPHGEETTTTRILNEGFHSIEIHDYIDVVIHRDANNKEVTLKGGSRLIPLITTDVSDSLLTIRHELSCKWSRNYDQRYSIHLYLPRLKRIKYYGSGNITCTDTIPGDTLVVDSWNGTGAMHLKVETRKIILGINSGPADIKAEGKTQQLFIWQQGLGHIDAKLLSSPYVWVDHGATGDAYLSPDAQNIDVLHYGIGNIFYPSQAQLHFIRKDGPGKLIPY